MRLNPGAGDFDFHAAEEAWSRMSPAERRESRRLTGGGVWSDGHWAPGSIAFSRDRIHHQENPASALERGEAPVQINVEVPEEFVLERGAAAMARRLKLYAALRMFQSGELSAGGASQLADVDRFTFAAECKRHGIPLVDYPADELRDEFESIRRAS